MILVLDADAKIDGPLMIPDGLILNHLRQHSLISVQAYEVAADSLTSGPVVVCPLTMLKNLVRTPGLFDGCHVRGEISGPLEGSIMQVLMHAGVTMLSSARSV